MSTVVMYESMFGNTRAVAEEIADELRRSAADNVSVVPVAAASDVVWGDQVDLLVLGAPTHTWGMSRPSTRKGASDTAAKPGSRVTLESGATGTGMREWLAGLSAPPARRVAVFDTRMHAPMHLSGSASRPITKRLRRLGATEVGRAGFFVDRSNVLEPGEFDRARAWARRLVEPRVTTPRRPGTRRGAARPA